MNLLIFRITYEGEKTGYLLKNNDNDDYMLNLKPSEHLFPMNVGHVLLNTNDEKEVDTLCCVVVKGIRIVIEALLIMFYATKVIKTKLVGSISIYYY